MDEPDFSHWSLATQAIRAGYRRTQESEHSEAIFPTSSFVFSSAAEAEALFDGSATGNIYSRFTNPTVTAFERRLAILEGGEACVATASGMAAILALCMGLLQQGDHLVASRSLFGTSVVLFNKYLARFGIRTSFVDLTDLSAWKAAMEPNTKLLFLETPSNPLTEIADLSSLAALAHEQGALLAVDNCLATPALQRPLALGADIVVHSATKYLDGQGRCLGGAVIGDAKHVGEDVFGVIRTCGPSMSPFNAWVFLKGMETLALRMQAHCANALALARRLEAHPRVRRVYYPGLDSYPQKALAARQQSGFGGVLAFEVEGGREAAWRVVDATRFLSITANLGDAKTTITHPATTTHGRLSPEEMAATGITQGLLRISVGLEDVEDIWKDLERGLDISH